MIGRVFLFGATGDLAGRFIFPAFAELEQHAKLPEDFEIVGVGRSDLNDESFRARIAKKLQQFGSDIEEPARGRLLQRIRFHRADVSSPEVVEDLRELAGDGTPFAAYLALPPTMFVPAVRAIGDVGLPAGSRIIVEKPFGENLENAKELNRLLLEVTGAAGESGIFRVDHALGMATIHNLLGFRLANRVFEPVWNSEHIEQVEILWEETIALEGRAAYYDRAGALEDVMQNHMLQVLCLVAMEPPASLSERDLRDRKVDVLRTVRPPEAQQMRKRTRRARYTAGRLATTGDASGQQVPDYTAEEGVDPKRNTETWAEVELELESWRWSGTRFVLRAGKALSRRRRGVIITFREVPHLAFGEGIPRPPRNELRIGIDGPKDLSLYLTGSAPGPPLELEPLVLRAELPADEPRAYSAVLLDALSGDCTLSIRGDEAEESWRIMEPVIAAWNRNVVPLEEYPAGSAGPPARERTLAIRDISGELADAHPDRSDLAAEQ